jgi:hypothetical protein
MPGRISKWARTWTRSSCNSSRNKEEAVSLKEVEQKALTLKVIPVDANPPGQVAVLGKRSRKRGREGCGNHKR